MEQVMKEIKIENFITIKLLQFKRDVWIYFVDYYNEKYFYIDELEELSTHQNISPSFILKFHKAKAIYDTDIETLKNSVYDLHKQLTFKIPRAKRKEKYYIITIEFKVVAVTELNSYADRDQYKSYNYFTSENQAREFASKLQDALIDLWKEEREKNNCTKKSYN